MNDTSKPNAEALLRRFSNALFISAADEHKEGVSDAAVQRRYEASTSAHNELLDEIKALMTDKERLDWLDAEGMPDAGTYPVMALTVKSNHDRNSCEWVNVVGTAREAIDRARKIAGKSG